eukprot:scaffold63_cov306-Pinguiococcus_pyrenoidosus.AAC.44
MALRFRASLWTTRCTLVSLLSWAWLAAQAAPVITSWDVEMSFGKLHLVFDSFIIGGTLNVSKLGLSDSADASDPSAQTIGGLRTTSLITKNDTAFDIQLSQGTVPCPEVPRR